MLMSTPWVALLGAVVALSATTMGQSISNGTCLTGGVPTLTSKGYGIVTALSDTATVRGPS